MHKIGHISFAFTNQCHSLYFPSLWNINFHKQCLHLLKFTAAFSNSLLLFHNIPWWIYTFTTILGDMCCHTVVNHWQRRVTLGILILPAWVTVWSPSKSTHYTAALGGLWMVCLQEHVCGGDHGYFFPVFNVINLVNVFQSVTCLGTECSSLVLRV